MRSANAVMNAGESIHPPIHDRTILLSDDIEPDAMTGKAFVASQFLRCIANQHRLMVLCHLTRGEASVGQLERELGIRQAHLSQQLARLRQDGLVTTRRDSRTIYYALGSDAAREFVGLVYRLFCAPDISAPNG